ncbi:MAG: hypothetical protein E6K69_03530 [Nitrospirae bacterium]|nr:MAG: hypothetical protein E6K69_03530 [Nitrospirota bacterium]
MLSVRSFTKEDIPRVVELRRRILDWGEPPSKENLKEFFRQTFLENPWDKAAASSLVCQDDKTQRIIGFLGVVPRPMLLNGTRLQVAVCTQFIVEPAHRGLAGLQLLNTFFSGLQDLALCDEASENVRKIWQFLGGTTSLLYSIHWVRPLRPCAFALSAIRNRKQLSWLALAATPFAKLVDFLAVRIPGSHLYQSPPSVPAEDLSPKTFLSLMSDVVGNSQLCPEYDESTWKWVLDRSERMVRYGNFQKVVVKDKTGEVLGWYLYYLNRGGVSEVLQIAARKGSVDDVLGHLIYNAWQHGSVVLSGRLEPRLMQAFSDRYCLLHCGGFWTLVHSKKPDLLTALCQGNAFLSRMEGEWCLRID